jgi:uncharacterized protein YpuA (DUF1002 family)
MECFLWKRTVPPKNFTRDQVRMKLSSGVSGEVTVQAKLYYSRCLSCATIWESDSAGIRS